MLLALIFLLVLPIDDEAKKVDELLVCKPPMTIPRGA
jgi:hypothetical protein